VSLLLAAGLMLEHVGRQNLAERLRAGIDGAINQDNVRTGDMGGRASTREFAAAIARRVSAAA
jgi:isocitrate dehydrogenase (NAD+)